MSDSDSDAATPHAAPEPAEYASPPCYAAEFPGYFGESAEPAPALAADQAWMMARLNALLEAERAGARVLAMIRDALPEASPLHALLARVQKDEGANAVILYKTVRRLGGEASHDTGAFVGKTLAIDGLAARLHFVNKGQEWVVRKIDELVSRVSDPEARAMLYAMRASHLDNIAACGAFLAEGVED